MSQFSSLPEQVWNTYRSMGMDGVIRGSQGNVSVLDRERNAVFITPSHVPAEELSIEDIVLVDMSGRVAEGKHRPSSETRMHLAIYQHNSNVGAIVHAHCPYASVFAILHEPIPVVLVETAGLVGNPVRVAPFAPPGSEELGRISAEMLGEDLAVLLANHGLVTVGPTLDIAYEVTLACENTARLVIMARSLSPTLQPLGEEFIKQQHDKVMARYARKSGNA